MRSRKEEGQDAEGKTPNAVKARGAPGALRAQRPTLLCEARYAGRRRAPNAEWPNESGELQFSFFVI